MELENKVIMASLLGVLSIFGAFASREYSRKITEERLEHSRTVSVLNNTLEELNASKAKLIQSSSALRETEARLKTSQQGKHTETRLADGSVSITDEWNNILESSFQEIEKLNSKLIAVEEKNKALSVSATERDETVSDLKTKIEVLESSKSKFRYFSVQAGQGSGAVGAYVPLGMIDLGLEYFSRYDFSFHEAHLGLRF